MSEESEEVQKKVQEEAQPQANPLGTQKVGSLILQYGIPSIISMVVGSIYNIVDQIFIGQGVGLLGNAATNVAFPIVTVCTAVALMLGIGGSSNFNLSSGKGDVDRAERIIGTALSSLVIAGVILMIIVLVFLDPLLDLFGATPDVLPYAQNYAGITAFGIPFFVLMTGGSHLVRADGSPNLSMVTSLSGAILNMILDPIFIFIFHWGIQGAAWATVTSQVVSALLVIVYFVRFKHVHLNFDRILPKPKLLGAIISLGTASFINQIAIALSQVAMNDTLRYFGASSIYGTDIPLACVGVIMKVNNIFMCVCIGISQGCQPIWGFNCGAKKYDRVRQAYWYSFRAALVVGIIFFLAFQLFPVQIVSIFGTGSELYYEFAKKFFRIFLFCTFLNGIQPMCPGFFTSIGKAGLGIIVSLTRQVVFLIPPMLIFAMLFGLDGMLYAGPVADVTAFIVAFGLAQWQLRKMKQLEEEKGAS